MLILAFDTTNEHGGAGIFRNLECVASVTAASQAVENTTNSSNYCVLLFQMVDRLLAESSLKLRDIELFAVANGPGSFTGIRVGVAAAQAWAQAFARPVLGASVLEAMVEEARPESDCAVAVMDARRGEFFVGAFRSSSNRLLDNYAGTRGGTELSPPPQSAATALNDLSDGVGSAELKLRPSDARAELFQQPAKSKLPDADGPRPDNRQRAADAPGQAAAQQVARITARTHESKREFILKWDALGDFITELSASGAVTCLVRENDERAQELRTKLATGLGGDRSCPQDQNEPPVSFLESKPNALLSGRLVYWQTVRGPLLPAIARLALQAHHDGRLQRPEELDAAYIRRSDAEMRWQE